MNQLDLWRRFRDYLCTASKIGLRLDISRMGFEPSLFDTMGSSLGEALAAMEALERGGVANPDEKRMVGHYWLRAPALAPDQAIKTQIEQCIANVKQFGTAVHDGTIKPPQSDGFYVVLVIGIGGSALGAQFICDAMETPDDPMLVRFIDNTDPDGMDRILDELNETLDQTLTIVVSKSGTTVETTNGLTEVADAYKRAGLDFAKHAVAVTCAGSVLHERCEREGWLAFFPMWDWVGGRTSVTSSAGLLPLALQGGDVDAFLDGARDCDQVTRDRSIRTNPAALLAMMWHSAGDGRGSRNMVVLPYCDRLALLGRYLQQLVMESLGKNVDRSGRVVAQGLTVFGNKGSTDQHAFVQQLRDGRNDFFVSFVEVLRDRRRKSIPVKPGATSGDYLNGFLYGTRAALTERGRPSLTITLDELNARSLGTLVALFERTVGLYAELIDINAYHQPGVEAGKKAAEEVLRVQGRVLDLLGNRSGSAMTVEEIAEAIGEPESVEIIFHVLEHAVANVDHHVKCKPGKTVPETQYEVGS